MEIAEFLLARIAEDEAVAREARPKDDVWYAPGETHLDTDAEEKLLLRFSPARVLAECEAKRQIVEALADKRNVNTVAMAKQDNLLAVLALPYADHPDYDPEWKV